MEDEKGRNEGQNEKSEKEEVFTKVVRAGKRTYFFDVKSTRHEDLYLTITESKKRPGKEGKMFYEKHKIFLYKEDFRRLPSLVNHFLLRLLHWLHPLYMMQKVMKALDFLPQVNWLERYSVAQAFFLFCPV